VKVLVVSSYPPRHCGIGAYARDQVSELRGEGHEVTVLSPPDGEGDVRVPFFGGRAFLRAAGMGWEFDRVIVHFQPTLYYRPRAPLSKVLTSLGLLGLVLHRRRTVELLVHEADPPVRWRPDYLLLRQALRKAGRVWFHTDTERAALERDYRVRVRGGIVAHRVRPPRPVSRAEARQHLGLEDRRPVFVCAGFLQPSKGFDRAVEAFARADADGAALYVVGSIRDRTTQNEEYVAKLSARCQAVPGVTLIERFVTDDEFDLWMAAADWLLLPYRKAWSSGVLARAQAIGTPAIVSAVGGLPEQAGEGDMVFDGDEDLARALLVAAASAGAPRSDRSAPSAVTSGGAPPGEPEIEAPQPEAERSEPEIPASDVRKKGRVVLIGLILLSVLLAAVAQLTLKFAMNQVTDHGAVPLSLRDPADTVRRIALTPAVWGGLLMFGLSASFWLIVLSRTSLSFAYPFASLTYVLILVFDRFVLRTPVSALRYGGVALIIGGLVLISRTHHTA
jgi:glycosyltransferase involved in cell wall biosynthesis/multidrug transporter EmrE-like cation transporter